LYGVYPDGVRVAAQEMKQYEARLQRSATLPKYDILIKGQMPPPTYHCGGQVMASDTTSLSLPEFTVRQPMICFPQHGLNHRLFPAQGVEADLARVEIELRADQAVGPPRIDRIAPFQ
jgi:hypothetical protein